MSQKLNITSPVGRIVMGSLYDPMTTDAEGKPLVIKTGPNAGQPRVNYFIALAIPKGAERHWGETPWGAQIWQTGHTAFPGIAASPSFAWKIEDGDSQIPNKKGRKPCDNEGWKGNWIVKLSGGFAPKIYQQEGAGYVQITQKDFVKPGYFVEVAFTVEGNGSSQTAGVYLNHSMVCFRAYGQEINFGPNVNEAGFGQAALPTGASPVPLAGTAPLPQMQPAAALPLPNVPVAAPAPSYAPVAVVMPAPAMVNAPPAVPVVPNTGFLNVPGATPMPPAPPVAAPMPVAARQMTAAANGIPYASYIAQGWTDAQLVQQGMMLA